jgi:hypothetical protein
MNKAIASKKSKTVQNSTGWERILADAEVTLREVAAEGRSLKRAIRAIKGKIAAGEPLPDYAIGSTNI